MNFILHTARSGRPIYRGGEKGSDLLGATPPLRLEQELLGLAVPSSPRGQSSQSCAVVILWSWVQIRLLPMRVTQGESLRLSGSQSPHQCSVQSSRSVVSDSLRPHGLHAGGQASLSITNSRSLLKVMSIESVMPPNHLILCCPLLLLPSIFRRIRVFSNESVLRIRWPKYWSFIFSISPFNEMDLKVSAPPGHADQNEIFPRECGAASHLACGE